MKLSTFVDGLSSSFMSFLNFGFWFPNKNKRHETKPIENNMIHADSSSEELVQ
jgi:hypothetical protein